MHRYDDHRRSAADRVLPLQTRGDLETIETGLGGETLYVVRDPVAAEAFHFSREEYAVLEALRQPTSLRQLQRLLEARFAPRRASLAQLQDYVARLYELGLLIGRNAGQAEQLLRRRRQQRRQSRLASLLQVLAIRLGGVPAAPLVDRLYRPLRWCFTPAAMVLAAAIVGCAAVVAIGSADELARRAPAATELLSWRYLPVWIASIVAVKALHELGHALACRHFGAQPQELGVMLLAGMPTLYCDVSDSWRLPGKWPRIAISSAGVLVELLAASIALLLWRLAAPGLVSTICLSLVVVCSVGTLLVNLNPLLRYDGYYVLADWLETPNLAARARGLLSSAWRSWLLGEPDGGELLLSPRKRRALWVYAILSKLYLGLVLAALLIAALRLARPYELEGVVYLLAGLVAAGALRGPLASLARIVGNPALRARCHWSRLAGAGALLALIAAGVAALPMTRRVEARLVVMPADARPLFAATAGEIRSAVPAGRRVAQGDPVVRLHNPELALAAMRQAGVVRQHRLRVEQLAALRAALPAASQMLPTAQAELADAEAQLAELEAMVESLVVRAPIAGTVLAPPPRPADRAAGGRLRTWTGSPLDGRNQGAWVETGTPLAIVAASGGHVAWAAVEPADAPEVCRGQAVRLAVEQIPLTHFRGQVAEVARRARRNHESPASAAAPPEHGEDWYHVARIDLAASTAPLLPGGRGRASIVTDDATLGGMVVDRLRRTFLRVF